MEPALTGLLAHGPMGMAMFASLVLAGIFHKTRLADVRERLEEHKADRELFINIITNNSEAITKNSSVVENCTNAIQQNSALIMRLLEKTRA